MLGGSSMELTTTGFIILKGLLLMSIIYSGLQVVIKLILSFTIPQSIEDNLISRLSFAIALYYIFMNIV